MRKLDAYHVYLIMEGAMAAILSMVFSAGAVYQVTMAGYLPCEVNVEEAASGRVRQTVRHRRQRLVVVERHLQQCCGGVQKHYTVRFYTSTDPVSSDRFSMDREVEQSVLTKLLSGVNEMELVAWTDAVAHDTKPANPAKDEEAEDSGE